ncbi:hypothetical protein CMK14_24470 [Candidatus Poribacteria bacterium]|nr:hypothetical protein [Candidatus Poribacteria bacterium]
MRKMAYLSLLLILIGLTVTAQDSNSPPEVTNVMAQQVDQQVEISYDLLDQDGDLMTVSLQVSSDGGSNFDLEAKSLAGEVGEGIASGKGKKIVWQVSVDIPDLYGTNFVFEVVADDHVEPTAGFVHPVDKASMALIPAGSFEMGDHLDMLAGVLGRSYTEDAKPVHTVEFYDVLGELVRQLELGMVRAGRYVTAGQAAYWDGKTEVGEAVSSGTYFYQLKAGDYTETRKMVILK